VFTLLVASGCASARPAPARPAPESNSAAPVLQRAERALTRGNHSEAIAELLLVAGRGPATEVERHALLTAAAVALDPSNASRQLDLGASLAARYLATAPTSDVNGRPLAQSLYLIALELGAERSMSPACGAARGVRGDTAAPATLPTMDTPSVPERIRLLERELTRLREELLRIRRTLEPPPR
jgi:hypothetical protein